jgi:orotate phosphoribosyltransferase
MGGDMDSTTDQTSESIDSLRKSFALLCRNSNVTDKEKRWVYLDRLWWNVKARDEYVKILLQYISILLSDTITEKTILISPDTVSCSYGASPAIFIAAHELKINVAVWQEVGDYFNKRPLLIGTNSPDLNCIVIQDVIRSGTTILKMMDLLQARNWSLFSYCGLLLNCTDSSKLQKTKEEYFIRHKELLSINYLLSIDELL